MQPVVSLVGLPGAGKTTIGRQLARALRWPFIDVDHEIERLLGCTIREYFARCGEEAFRQIEETTLAQLLDGAPSVVSTGGGAVLKSSNRAALRNRSSVVYLRSAPEELHRRLRHDTQRPLLQVADPLRALRDLYAARDPLYRETAHFVIETGRPSVGAVVQTILMQLELAHVIQRPGTDGSQPGRAGKSS